MKSKFNNSDNSLTVYALACGYQEIVQDNTSGKRIRLVRESGGFYSVKGCGLWEDFNYLYDARKFFFKMIKDTFGISRKQYLSGTNTVN